MDWDERCIKSALQREANGIRTPECLFSTIRRELARPPRPFWQHPLVRRLAAAALAAATGLWVGVTNRGAAPHLAAAATPSDVVAVVERTRPAYLPRVLGRPLPLPTRLPSGAALRDDAPVTLTRLIRRGQPMQVEGVHVELPGGLSLLEHSDPLLGDGRGFAMHDGNRVARVRAVRVNGNPGLAIPGEISQLHWNIGNRSYTLSGRYPLHHLLSSAASLR